MRTVYVVRNLDGYEVARHWRMDRADGSKKVWWEGGGVKTSELPLYGTERLATLEIGRTVLVTEGEKAAEACWRLGYPAVGTVTGASGCPGEDALAVLLPFDVVLWPDNDEPGRKHMARVAAGLIRLGGSCRILGYPGWDQAPGDDAADYVGDAWRLWETVTSAGVYRPAVEETRPAVRPIRGAAFPEDRVERARQQIESVVASRLGPPARADRRSLWWSCPFHADKSPSFKVDLEGGFFKCFGCDAKGDAITFVREHDGLGFTDALRELVPVRAADVAVPVWGCDGVA